MITHQNRPRLFTPFTQRLAYLLPLLQFATLTSLSASDYETVREILVTHCYSCHSAKKSEGGLRLDRVASLRTGGDSGPSLIPHMPDQSELVSRITSSGDDRMPPEGPHLTAAQIEHIRTWISAGLPGLPADDAEADNDPRLKHWAWQSIATPNIPDTVNGASIENPIDAFVAQKQQAHGLSMSKIAPLPERLRRLSYDLRGIPLTPHELTDFGQYPGEEEAYRQAVDQFLTDPAYGEKWARHWLDIAHYADTHGFERDQRRPNAWRYRDYVIDSWNHDRPYHEFVRQQIAGDIIDPRNPLSVIATGFLSAGPYDFVGQEETQNEVLRRQSRADDLDDMLTQVMTSLCGVTIHCARCHDHKLDPISQSEYYSMIALFADVHRTDRPIDYLELKGREEQQTRLAQAIATTRSEIAKRQGKGLNLADLVGGGSGFGTGQLQRGLDPASGNVQIEKRGFLKDFQLNRFRPITTPGIDGVAIPDGDAGEANGRMIISSTGIEIPIPATSGECWDAIRNGPVNSQHSTMLDGVDYNVNHSLLGTHANAAITFDLAELRQVSGKTFNSFRSAVGYFGETAKEGASVSIFLDGVQLSHFERIGRTNGIFPIQIPLNSTNRFLTLLVTDAGNGIGHDQVCFVDPTLVVTTDDIESAEDIASREREIAQLQEQLDALIQDQKQLPEPLRYYGINAKTSPAIFRLRRGNPEDPIELAKPGTISCVSTSFSPLGEITTDQERREEFARWLTADNHPLVARVIVNRLWHYHFGRGLVETPSDFGLGGSPPTHPELLDWLATQLIAHDWSIKHIQRLICSSHTYQQSSERNVEALTVDSGNQWLWRRSAKRLDSEALRDSILAISGCLDRKFHGPGYEDFEYQEEYAPVYRYVPANQPALWRRSIYRFIVRTTTHQFMATLDCPNAANLTPVRDRTTTPLQALALRNNDFMRDQARRFAERLKQEKPDGLQDQIEFAFQLCFNRNPAIDETEAARALIAETSLDAFCLVLFNANEFIFVD
jgi:mono/diheme cytochrome c family protein